MPEQQSDSVASRVLVIVPLLVAVGYVALSLVAFYRQDWLPGTSILHMALLGPPALLVWGGNALGLYCACTVAIVLLCAGAAAVRSDELQFLAALATLAIWLGAGFFAAALSI